MYKMDVELRNQDLIGANATPFRVGVFPVPGFALMSYASTVEPLRAANLLARARLYDVVHFSGEVGQIVTILNQHQDGLVQLEAAARKLESDVSHVGRMLATSRN